MTITVIILVMFIFFTIYTSTDEMTCIIAMLCCLH